MKPAQGLRAAAPIAAQPRRDPRRRAAGRRADQRARAGAVAALCAAAAAAAAAPPAPQLPALVEAAADGPRVGASWRVATLPRQTKPVTRFSAERVDDRDALRIDAHASYGNLVHDLPAVATPHLLRWAWRIETPNPGTDLRLRAGDDLAAKVCVSFELPLDRVPFGERVLLRLARAASGEALPAATLCWVWGRPEAHGALIDNAYTRRIRCIVLRNADDAPGRWFDEARDIGADFRRAFGDEAADPPPLVAVIVGGDSDNTGAHTVAQVGGLRFEP